MASQLTIKTTVQPKPTRAEIIDAMTTVECERRNKKQGEQVARRNQLQKELEASLANHFLAQKSKGEPEIRWGYRYRDDQDTKGVQITYGLDNLPAALVKKLNEYHGLPERVRDVRFCDVRKEMLARVSGIDKAARVSRLLTDDESRKSVEKLLDAGAA